jgi:AcrR family transcriptional regulator
VRNITATRATPNPDIEAADALNLIPTRDEEFVVARAIMSNDYRNSYLVSSGIVSYYQSAMEQETAIEASGVSGQRGPADHKRRQQILQAADEHFRLYGYRKTTLADIAKSIHLSTPYIYKFFDSKQSIGEAMCWHCLSAALSEIEGFIEQTKSPVDKLRRVFTGLEEFTWRLLSEQRKIQEMVAVSFDESWESIARFREGIFELIRRIIVQGRESGEFERKTPLEESARAIARMTELFYHPTLREQAGKRQEDEALAVANVAIRSLTA